MEQPHGMEVPGDIVCRLKKAIYGLRTAPRYWQQKIYQVLANTGFKPFQFDENVYRRDNITISTYVDDFIVLSPDKAIIVSVVELLGYELYVKDLGDLSLFLGIEIQLNTNGIRISHKAKI